MACGAGPTEEPTPVEPRTTAPNPPFPEPIEPIEPELDPSNYTVTLNPQHKKHGNIYKTRAGCYVTLPFTPDPDMSLQPAPTKEVACPASMEDPAWDVCRSGTITANEDKDACICFVAGNPPAPPSSTPCPKAH